MFFCVQLHAQKVGEYSTSKNELKLVSLSPVRSTAQLTLPVPLNFVRGA